MKIVGDVIRLDRFQYVGSGKSYPILRPRRGKVPHLSSYRLRYILEKNSIDYDFMDLEEIWSEMKVGGNQTYDIVALSTTFICHLPTLKKVVNLILEKFPSSVIILGGQYSNLKYKKIMDEIPKIEFIIRGDGEESFPQLLSAIEEKTDFKIIPNLVFRDTKMGNVVETEIKYIDFNDYPSPTFVGNQESIPYESMRGCPYDCKFCSYPSASPKWRYKTAAKVCEEWKKYAKENNVKLIKAMDSTFTIPKDRFRKLLDDLPQVGVEWESYARADAIDTPHIIEQLESSHCKSLSIGFESMSDTTLQKMSKNVSAKQNLKAFELLNNSNIDFRVSFIIGYPGETPHDYEQTHKFIVEKFTGRFLLSVFSLLDETMPVWDDAVLYGIEITNSDDPEYSWRHKGMSSQTAFELWRKTVEEARWKNEDGVMSLWQTKYENPLVPELDVRKNRRIEKLVERLSFLKHDFKDERVAREHYDSIIKELNSYNIVFSPSSLT